MSEQALPQGWTSAQMGQVCITTSQRVPDPDEMFTYIDIGSVDRNTKKVTEAQHLLGKDAPSRARKVVQKGDVLVSMTRPNLNAVALVDDKFDGQIASTGFDVLRPIGIEPRWIFEHVRSQKFIEEMSEKVQGALYPAIKSKDVRDFIIPIPPFNEQRRIADKLDQLLAAVDSCKTRLDTIPGIIKRFRQSVLAAATSGVLTADWRVENSNSFDWSEVVLEDVAEDFSYGTSAKSSKEGTVPVLRMGNIQSGNLDWNDLVFTSDAAEIKKFALQAGDVLFNRTNSPELVGKTAVYKGEKQAIFAGYLIRVRCSEKLLPDFLNYRLNSPDGKTYCWQVKTDGVSQSNINAKKLAALPFLLPPLNEQHEIVRRVEALFAVADNLEARYQTARAQIDHLTPSLLAKAFRGELVPQDPNDEPAEKLLERIRAVKVETPVKLQSRRKSGK